MEIIQIVALGLTAVVVISVLKPQRPEFAVQISIITGIAIVLLLSGKITSVINLLHNYTLRAGVDTAFFSVMLKIIGIAYITEFSSEICRDSGENAIATKIELAGKIIIIVLAVPVMTSLLDLIVRIMP